MNRNIRFRGKVLKVIKKYHPCKVGEWAYGDLLHAEHDFIKGVDIITDDFSQVVADENTIGQFTGLKDKNGKDIYEGDIVKTCFSEKPFGIVKWHPECYFYIDDTMGDASRTATSCSYRPLGEMARERIAGRSLDIEVIGNRWDNPEILLKK